MSARQPLAPPPENLDELELLDTLTQVLGKVIVYYDEERRWFSVSTEDLHMRFDGLLRLRIHGSWRMRVPPKYGAKHVERMLEIAKRRADFFIEDVPVAGCARRFILTGTGVDWKIMRIKVRDTGSPREHPSVRYIRMTGLLLGAPIGVDWPSIDDAQLMATEPPDEEL